MFSPLLMRHETASSHFSPNTLAALPEKDGCKNRFYMHMRLAFFQKEEESFWHHLNGNPHFRQGIMAMLRLQSLLFKLKKWQLYTAILSSNYGKAHLCYVEVDEFDAEPDLINTLSGIVSLKTKKLLPHDMRYRFTWCSPVRYNPDADGSLWLDFISATVENEDMVGYLQEALGYGITGHTSEEILFYIFGPPRAGKGTLTETLLALFPRPIAIEVDFNTFTAKREGDAQNFDLAPMKAARLVFASESNKYQSLNPAKVKALTGGNLVHCAFKYGQFFFYRPQYAVWLSSNHEVNADADDDALWGRVKVIHFPYSQLGKEDTSLKRRMQSPENLEAVLAWLVDGVHLWYQHEGQGLPTPDAVSDLTRAHRDAQDAVGLWLDECCEMKETEWVENTKVMTSYKNWCEANGYEPKKQTGLSQSLAAHGLEVSVQKRIHNPSGTQTIARGVQGLSLL